jgi:hypothetical protein
MCERVRACAPVSLQKGREEDYPHWHKLPGEIHIFSPSKQFTSRLVPPPAILQLSRHERTTHNLIFSLYLHAFHTDDSTVHNTGSIPLVSFPFTSHLSITTPSSGWAATHDT